MDAKAKAKAALIELASAHLDDAQDSLETGTVSAAVESVKEALEAVLMAERMGGAK